MTRKCSHCGHNGHNSRTCPDRGVRLFGVRLTEGMRKSASMGNLLHYNPSAATPEPSDSGAIADGYVSDGLVQTSSNARERKKGVPWTEEEHRCFLLGLQKLGKGDWRGIAKNFVTTRTPTQVASHAQKYFIRQSNLSKRKRRSSLFDISPEVDVAAATGGFDSFTSPVLDAMPPPPLRQLSSGPAPASVAPTFRESLQPFPVAMALDSVKEEEVMDSSEGDTTNEETNRSSSTTRAAPVAFLHPVPVPIPVAVPVWLGLGPCMDRPPAPSPSLSSSSKLVRPTASLPRAPVRLDSGELPQLRLGLSVEPLKLDEPSTRHSAFHSKSSSSSAFSSNLRDRNNVPISVV
ncbi:transcription factor MYBS3 isoform X1 [Selaginella moellendorffii]|uniref:transcription factor MYBS3 isoform X1 n=1 Tax=Selaginella moellendorffii TaxID=88036 RepID=UPI000D1C34FC|nr:transcription factor MYBS3 isoform X1 [Selaginella moellendorffii]|eukprot:XP_002990122.2 transcription factor MYBS3 isoform X1 [Selaginella moellendorffii]